MSSTIPISVLPQNSIILVTGVTGLLGAGVAQEALKFGYKVRGAVRSIEKAQALKEKFDQEFGKDKFVLVQVEDFTVPNAYDEALKGK